MTTPADIIEAFVREVGAFIDARSLLPPGAAVVVGVSGGADSAALLAVLRRLAAMPARGYRLTAAHLNHALRPDAQADADFVADLARRWGIPCVVGRREVAAEARAAGQGIEQAAREARYEFLTQTAKAAGASHVAVAHHADDNVETILYRVVRGTHLRGLAGISASRGLGDSGIALVRPLLERKRVEIEEFCRAEALAWCADSTNADTSYRRNFIRHDLLPLLRSRLNRRADEALLRLAQAAAGAEDVLSSLARAALAGASAVARASCPRVPRASCPRASSFVSFPPYQ
jgi:tRNA(Ile)-lysidine synthase